jgi:hypothetical protein
VIGAALALLSLLLATTAIGRAAGATIALTSSPDTVEVVAQGFQAEEVVTVWLTGPRGQVVATDAYHSTDGQGEARFALSLSAANEVGRWTITIYGLDSELEAYAQVDRETADPSSAGDDDADDADSDEDSDEDSEDSDEGSDEDSEGDSD